MTNDERIKAAADKYIERAWGSAVDYLRPESAEARSRAILIEVLTEHFGESAPEQKENLAAKIAELKDAGTDGRSQHRNGWNLAIDAALLLVAPKVESEPTTCGGDHSEYESCDDGDCPYAPADAPQEPTCTYPVQITRCPPHKFQPRRIETWECAFTYESAGAISHCMRIEASAVHAESSALPSNVVFDDFDEDELRNGKD